MCLTGIDSRSPAAHARVNGVSVLDDLELDLAEDEPQRRVGQQRAGQQARLAEHLEAVADPEHEAAGGGELGHLLHHRREAGDRAGAQVVAVGEAAGDDHRIDALQVAVAVPQDHRLADPLGTPAARRPHRRSRESG